MTENGNAVDRTDDHCKWLLPPPHQVTLSKGANQVEVGNDSRKEDADQQDEYEPAPVGLDCVVVEED